MAPAKTRCVDVLREQLRIYGLTTPELVEEHRFLADRRFRFDFAVPRLLIAIEVEGGVFSRAAGGLDVVGGKLVQRGASKSRHTTGAGYTRDCEKYNLAAMNGWMVLRFTSPMIIRGEAVRMVVEAVKGKGGAL